MPVPGFAKEKTSIEISEMSREEAIEFATEWLKTIDPDEKDSMTYAFLSYVIHAFQQKPKSDFVESQESEVAEWILLDECSNSGYYCSKCKKKLVKEGWSDTVKKIKYCPNCGIPIKEVEK